MGIFHIQNTLPIYRTFIEQIVKNFLDFYHRSPDNIEQILGSENVSPYEFIFEHSLQYTNEHLSRALQDLIEDAPKTSSLDLQKIHFILGAIMDGSLFLCTHGRAVRAHLLYPTKGSHPSTAYSLIDIQDSASDEHKENTQRLFSSVISGAISIPQSKLVLCNQAFLDYVSLEQLKHSLTNQKTESLTQYFHHLLSKANAKHDFTAIFIDPWSAPIPVNTKEQRSTISHSSIENLLEKQKGTSTVLKTKMIRSVLYIALTIAKSLGTQAKNIVSGNVRIIRSVRMVQFHRPSHFYNNIIPGIRSLPSGIIPRIVTIVSKLRTFIQNNLLPVSQKQMIRMGKYIKLQFDAKFRPLPPNSKALFIVGILFALLFIQSLFSIADKRSVKKTEAQQRDVLNKIEQNLNLAEASIIYEGDDKTKQTLSEADRIIRDIADQKLTNTDLANTLSRLQERYRVIQGKVSRIVEIGAPTVVAALDQRIPSPETIRFAGSGIMPLVLINGDGIYTVNVKNGEVKQVNTQTKISSIPCATSFTEALRYICSGSNRLFSYNANEDSMQAVPYSDGGRTLTDIAIFNKRLYTLDGVKGVIARHDRKGTGFGEGALWIRDGSVVQNARQFAIDGNVYVLVNAMTIDVYNAGQKTRSIPLPVLQNPISEITQLWTNDETDYLYLLDSIEKRILVFDKRTYAYVLSVSSPLFSNGIQDIIATKSDLFAISGGTLLKIPLEKIKL
ncbi:hypothetical protein HY621_00540 [Candidatus Uhrbacteria bacterium]|nr:hypothetical protein [Candidatus Uhrbacteria bacterium]